MESILDIEPIEIQANEVKESIPPQNFTNLTAKQNRFVQSYLVNNDASLSAKNAGYPAKTSASMGWQLLKNPKILNALDSCRTKIRSSITKETFIDKALEKFETLADTEPNSPRFLDIAGKALGYIGNNYDSRPNQTLNITLNKTEVNAMQLTDKWTALRALLESE